MRDPEHANYVDSSQYPSSVLPPFALGNFYLLSGDVATYLARNSDLLRPVGTLEDLSVGIWLMSLQVFPQHLPGVCTAVMCLYDMSLFSADRRSDRILAISGLRESDVFHCLNTHLIARAEVENKEKWYVDYFNLVADISYGKSCSLPEVSTTTEEVQVVTVVITPNTLYFLKSFVNLLTMRSSDASLVRVKLRCFVLDLLSLIRMPSVDVWTSGLVNETSHEIELEVPADVVNDALITGILDCGAMDNGVDVGGSTSSSSSEGFRIVFDPVQSNDVLNLLIRSVNFSSVWFVSGEPTDLSSLVADPMTDGRILHLTVVNTVTDPSMQVVSRSPSIVINNLFYPTFMTSVDEMLLVAKSEALPCYLLSNLLQAPTLSKELLASKTNDVAYLYFNCDRTVRESFFNILTERLLSVSRVRLNGVTALGQCNGKGKPNSEATLKTRTSSNYLHEAIEIYRPFKFVIAFENTQEEGYITEKLTNAFFAHSIPIYWGAPDVAEYFNPRAMINCNLFASLDACANRVVEVHLNDDLYLQMLCEPPIVNQNVVPAAIRGMQC